MSKNKTRKEFVTFHGKSGEYISGVPRKNLTQEMWDLVNERVQKIALDSGLYKFAAVKGKEGK